MLVFWMICLRVVFLKGTPSNFCSIRNIHIINCWEFCLNLYAQFLFSLACVRIVDFRAVHSNKFIENWIAIQKSIFFLPFTLGRATLPVARTKSLNSWLCKQLVPVVINGLGKKILRSILRSHSTEQTNAIILKKLTTYWELIAMQKSIFLRPHTEKS